MVFLFIVINEVIFLKFEMWSFGHILYILSPAIIMTALYFLLRNKSYKVKYIVGVCYCLAKKVRES